MLSFRLASAELRVMLAPVPRLSPVVRFSQAKLSSKFSPSASLAVTAQVSVLSLNAGSGEMLKPLMVGPVLSTVTSAVPDALAPKLSVAVMVQLTTAPGLTVAGVRVLDAVFPRDTPPVVQLNVSVRLSPSASLEVPEQVRVEEVLTPEAGETVTPAKLGA